MTKSSKSLIIMIALCLGAGIGNWLLTESVCGQTLRKDYRIDAPIQYQVDDPSFRGKVYRNHVGHAGFGYNCDNEECKRNSPYICWKCENRSCDEKGLAMWRRQLSEVVWRVKAGNCCVEPLPGCQCEPGVCLACNTHPGAVDINYSRLRKTAPPSQPAASPTEPQTQPSTSDYYRGSSNAKSSRRSRGITMLQRLDRESSKKTTGLTAPSSQTLSIREALEKRRRELTQLVEMDTTRMTSDVGQKIRLAEKREEMTQAERVRLLRSSMNGSGNRIR